MTWLESEVTTTRRIVCERAQRQRRQGSPHPKADLLRPASRISGAIAQRCFECSHGSRRRLIPHARGSRNVEEALDGEHGDEAVLRDVVVDACFSASACAVTMGSK
jgi:hypothetical protein